MRASGSAWLPVIAAVALVDAAVTLAVPAALGGVIDAIVAGTDVTVRVGAVAGLIAVGVVGDVVGTIATTACVSTTTARLRNDLLRHVLAIGPHRARAFAPGDLASRISANTTDAAQSGPALVAVGMALLPPAGSLVLLALIDPRLAAAFVAGVAVVALVLRAFAHHTGAAVAGYQRAQGRLSALLAESLAGARTIAAAGTIEREQRRVLAPLDDLRRHGSRTWRVLSRSSGQAAVAGPLVLVAVLAVGGLSLVDHSITAGELFAASRYAAIGAGLGGLTGVLGQLARARAGRRRIREVLTIEPIHYGPYALPSGPPVGRLELRGVTVRAGEAVLLDHVDLTVPAGSAVAVVGRSGAGKSVLAAVAARLVEPDDGVVLLDRIPLPDLRREVLRAAIGCAFDRPVLVGSTVADAVDPRPGAPFARTAARAAHAHDFVVRLPQGYDTPLAEAPLSGGERQRLGLARAWAAERLLVLDDATSALDLVTEMRVGRALAADQGRRTRLIVTHRAAVAAAADLVVWLDRGRVRGVAPHARLRSDPAYRAVFAEGDAG